MSADVSPQLPPPFSGGESVSGRSGPTHPFAKIALGSAILGFVLGSLLSGLWGPLLLLALALQITAVALGIVTLGKVSRGQAQGSSKAMAMAAVIIGGIYLLLGTASFVVWLVGRL